ncbi:MAG: ABC transporter permease [Gemmatimonadota bacterium]|nr:ABC transporter permease [Gemmatimonadota bacterium]
MQMFEAVRLALQTIWANKMKTAFSVIGVFIGVTFLIAVVSVVEGMNNYMTDRFAGTLLGVNTFHLRRFPNFQTGEVTEEMWRSWVRRPRISYEDATAVSEAITVPHVSAWESANRTTLEYRGKLARDIEVIAATERWFEIRNLPIAAGRAFSGQEVRAGTPVVVLGWELTERLFEGRDALGKEVKIQGIPYRVIGMVEKQGNLFGISLDKFAVTTAYAPAKRFVNPPGVVDALMVQTNSLGELQIAIAEAEAVMRTRRHLRPSEDNTFAIETADAVLDFWAKINRILMIALPGLVAISLVVGAIVIMNIMLMSVAERTREIGIRKSLGARRRDILSQFLVESATIATVGAAVGVGTGLAGAALVNAATPLPAAVAPWSILVGVALGAGVGIVAGIYPASRAARLDPISAIRHET